MTDEEIDTGKNLVTQAEIIRMLKKENADLKEQWKSMGGSTFALDGCSDAIERQKGEGSCNISCGCQPFFFWDRLEDC